MQLFSAIPEQIVYATEHYQQKSSDTSTLVQQLLIHYGKEGLAMPYTMEDFKRKLKRETLQELTLQEILEHFPKEEIVKILLPEERLEGLAPEAIENYLQKLKAQKPNPDS